MSDKSSVYIRVFDFEDAPFITLSKQRGGEPVIIGQLFANPEIYQEKGGCLDITSFVHFLLNNGFKLEPNHSPCGEACDYLYEVSHGSGTRWQDHGDRVRLKVSRRIYAHDNGMSMDDRSERLYEGPLNNIDWPQLDEQANAPQYDEPVHFHVEVQCDHGKTNLVQLTKTIRSALAISFIRKAVVEQLPEEMLYDTW